MPELTVITPGMSTIQGLGRYGAQRYGIAPGGAMDRTALAEANALVGQPAAAAAIEVGTLPLRLRATSGAVRLAATGALRSILLNGRKVSMRTSFVAADGDDVVLAGAQHGQFSYLAVQGGVLATHETPQPRTSLEPRSTAIRSWIFKAGDRLTVAAACAGQHEMFLPARKSTPSPIRVVLGPQLEYFTSRAVSQFLATTWVVSHAANRMGYLLDGARLPPYDGRNIISEGTVTGSIQIAGNGQPLAIMCDRGTVGGYPKIATIITADLGRFAQRPHNGPLTFAPVSMLEAQVAARDFATSLSNVKPGVKQVVSDGLRLATLLTCNIAGDVVDAMDWLPGDSPRPGAPQVHHINA